MPVLQGTVQQVFVKKLDAPKSFEYQGKTITNTHSRSLKLNDQWVGLGDYSPKFDEMGSTWTKNGTIQAGTEVVVNYTESPCGKYKNAKIGNIMITGGKTDPVPRNEQPQSSGSTQGSSYSGKANGAELGQAINLAVSVLGYTQQDFSDKIKASQAIEWYKSTKSFWGSVWDEPAAQAKEESPVEEDLDDSIPF